jgi:glycopeptide antibiotics resistance protein
MYVRINRRACLRRLNSMLMLKKIAPDKWRHFYVGILMGIVLQGLGWWLLPGSIVLSVLIAFAIVVAISYGFELFSLVTGMGHYDFMDAVASVIGGVLGMGVALLTCCWLF